LSSIVQIPPLTSLSLPPSSLNDLNYCVGLLLQQNKEREKLYTQQNEKIELLTDTLNQFMSAQLLPSRLSSEDPTAENKSQEYATRRHTPHSNFYNHTHVQNPSKNNSPSSQSINTTSSSLRDQRPYNGLVKVKQPRDFQGQNGISAQDVDSWISEMDHYLDTVGCDLISRDSLKISVGYLTAKARIWYDRLKVDQPIENWKQLSEHIRVYFTPVAQAQISVGKLLGLRYEGSVRLFTDSFDQHLLLSGCRVSGASEKFIMLVYLNGFEKATTHIDEARYLTTMLRNAINCVDGTPGKAKTLRELQATALLGESSLGNTTRTRTTTPSKINYKTNASATLPRYNNNNNNNNSWRTNNNNNNNHYKSNLPSRPNHTPPPNPSFSTPAKLNNVHFEDENEQLYENDSQDGNETHTHEDPNENNHTDDNDQSTHNEDESQEDVTFLHMLQMFKRNDLSPEEFDRRRKADVCFRCNKTGHYANKCPLNNNNKPKKK
jgi:hypothetical protein